MTRFLFAFAAFAPAAAFAQTCPTADVDLGSAVGSALSVGNTCQMGDDTRISCASSASEDVLHHWEAPADGTYVASLVGSAYDTALSLHDGTCGELACNDDYVSLQSAITFDALIGDEFFFSVEGFMSACGDFTLAITECTDGDGDGECDQLDPCFGQPDSDGDGFCDAIDYCEGDDATGDSDFDGVCNDMECVLDPTDTDGDGNCDAIDYCMGDDATGDDDFDGICNDLDFRLAITNNDATMETTLTVSGAPANTRIMFVSSVDGGSWCSGFRQPWGPLCFNMERPHRIGNAMSDANGDLVWTFVNPNYGIERLKFQAFWASPTDSDVTNLVWMGQN